MAPLQRRRGQPIIIYRSRVVIDSRGNQVRVVDETDPYHVLGWVIPQRSSRAEVPGQQDISVIRIGTQADLSGVDSWSQVEYEGQRFDVVVPPAYHHGTRQVRHWSMDCRARPHG